MQAKDINKDIKSSFFLNFGDHIRRFKYERRNLNWRIKPTERGIKQLKNGMPCSSCLGSLLIPNVCRHLGNSYIGRQGSQDCGNPSLRALAISVGAVYSSVGFLHLAGSRISEANACRPPLINFFPVIGLICEQYVFAHFQYSRIFALLMWSRHRHRRRRWLKRI